MKVAKNDKAVIILLSLIVLISMAVNVYNGYTLDVMRDVEPAISSWNYFGWWAASFGGSLLLFAISQTMYQEKKNGSMVVMGLTVLLAIFVIILAIL